MCFFRSKPIVMVKAMVSFSPSLIPTQNSNCSLTLENTAKICFTMTSTFVSGAWLPQIQHSFECTCELLMKLSSIPAQARIKYTFVLDSSRDEFTSRAFIEDKRRIGTGTTVLNLQDQKCVDMKFFVEVGCWIGLSRREICSYSYVKDTNNNSFVCRPVLKMPLMNLSISSHSALRVYPPTQISVPALLCRSKHPIILYVFFLNLLSFLKDFVHCLELFVFANSGVQSALDISFHPEGSVQVSASLSTATIWNQLWPW